MPVPGRYEICFCKKMISAVIFGVEYLISATTGNMLGKMVFFGVYEWRFWGSDGAPDGLGR